MPDIAIGRPPLTRSEWVDRQLREAILSGELKPGERLLTAALTERFSVSPSPLREALARLSGEGLVSVSPQRGARVTPLSLRACRELHELLSVNAPYALELAIAARGTEWETAVGEAATAFEEVWSSPAAPPDAERAFVRLHLTLVSACGSSWMLRIMRTLIENSGRYRVACLEHTTKEPFAADQRELVRACLSGDAAGARAAQLATYARTVTVTEQLVERGLLEVEEASDG
ncbi:GntR family transcriptional regulator [Nonomuraea sp. NPDC005983]|uniref:GntR family transcriptional regulator n=1 Tax=Nonomuraea sp. NPDC005983 TaxID=3155595 RepID=UPI0033B1189F